LGDTPVPASDLGSTGGWRLGALAHLARGGPPSHPGLGTPSTPSSGGASSVSDAPSALGGHSGSGFRGASEASTFSDPGAPLEGAQRAKIGHRAWRWGFWIADG
jgi:hypothetical protein